MKFEKYLGKAVELQILDFPDGLRVRKKRYIVRVINRQQIPTTVALKSNLDDLSYSVSIGGNTHTDISINNDFGNEFVDKVITYFAMKNGIVIDFRSKRINCIELNRTRDGNILLRNNPSAIDLTYKGLVSFLKDYDKNKLKYSRGGFDYESHGGACVYYASRLHDYSEERGVRAAVVVLNYIHALNAFETVDRGLIYVESGRFGTFVANIQLGVKYSFSDIYFWGNAHRTSVENIGEVNYVEVSW